MITPSNHRVVFMSGTPRADGVTVIVTVYNYEMLVWEALSTVAEQTFAPLSLVVVEDKGGDTSLDRCHYWFERNAAQFAFALLVQHTENSGLAAARNTAFALSHTPYVFVLDADNQLYPRCVEQCHEHLHGSEASLAYPMIEKFGDQVGLHGTELWSKPRLGIGNYIDAMALVRKSAWEEVGGYSKMETTGWEDYDLWCKFAARGREGIRVPMVLARYRVHGGSMLNTVTNKRIELVMKEMLERHPWLSIK